MQRNPQEPPPPHNGPRRTGVRAPQPSRTASATESSAGKKAGEAEPRHSGWTMSENVERGAPPTATREQYFDTPPQRAPTQEHPAPGDGPLHRVQASEEATERGLQGGSGPNAETASLSMASTIDDLLTCRVFGEAVEEWNLRSQQSDSSPSQQGLGRRHKRTRRSRGLRERARRDSRATAATTSLSAAGVKPTRQQTRHARRSAPHARNPTPQQPNDSAAPTTHTTTKATPARKPRPHPHTTHKGCFPKTLP